MTSSGEYTVSETARAAGISRQAYYKWLNRRLSLREQQEREVLEEIKRIEKRHQDSVGYDKMVRLHAILDLYGQRSAAWLISPTETREAAIKVFNQAAKASGTTPEMIHTDRGAAYTSTNYNEALRQEKVRHSLSAPGTPADNAVMEHWWADLKSIWLEHRPKAQTLAELQEQVRAGIMYFTNQFISAKRNDQTVAEYYHDLVG